MVTQRADARRNYGRILAVAEQEVAAHGADASLEQIARVAGVGSATVRRHFPHRTALLEAVFAGRVDELCARARELTATPDAGVALQDWLSDLTAHAASAQGMTAAMIQDGTTDEKNAHACSTRLVDAGQLLVTRAQTTDAIAPGVTATELIALVTGIALATERHTDPAAQAQRLLTLALRGITRRP